jgi:hypothetical protein
MGCRSFSYIHAIDASKNEPARSIPAIITPQMPDGFLAVKFAQVEAQK